MFRPLWPSSGWIRNQMKNYTILYPRTIVYLWLTNKTRMTHLEDYVGYFCCDKVLHISSKTNQPDWAWSYKCA